MLHQIVVAMTAFVAIIQNATHIVIALGCICNQLYHGSNLTILPREVFCGCKFYCYIESLVAANLVATRNDYPTSIKNH